MTVHRKCAIVLVILCANRCMARSAGADITNNNVSEESDDENIKQALVLVNLLKHEYVKAIRENHALRTRTTLTEESTCAPGDRPTSMSESVTTDPNPSTPQQPAPMAMSGRRFAVVTPFQQSMGRNGSKPYYLYRRRRVPVDYYYGSDAGASVLGNVLYRRQGPTEASNKPPDPVPSDSDIPDGTTLDSIPPSPVPSDPDAQVPDTAEPVTQDSDKLDPDDATEADATEPDVAYPEEAENTLDGIEEDPVQAQINSELEVELKATLKAANTHVAVSNRVTERTTKTYFMKPTLKVYLGGSTRYPIPLPENHAFCYTNPRNPLCRTAI